MHFLKTGGVVLGLVVILALFLAIRVFPDRQNSTTKVASSTQKQTLSTQSHQVKLSGKVLFIGDIMLARTIGDGIVTGQNPFVHVQSILNSYDLRVANIETTIADPSVAHQVAGKLYTFNAPLQAIQTLKIAGINVADLANNHTRDFGPAATSDMITRLENAGIKVVGAGDNLDQAFTPLVVDVSVSSTGEKTQTVKIGIVAVNSIENYVTNPTSSQAGSAFFDKDRILQEIKTARSEGADIVVVFPHWGTEYQTTPNSDQVSWGHFFIDSGADIVIGSHPHVIQTTETYNGKYIVYSLGNFIFDGMGGNALNGQMIGLDLSLKGTVDSNGVLQNKVVYLGAPNAIPIHIDSQGFPEPQ